MCKKRCILPFLFAILSLRYRTVKIPSLLENTSEDELVLSRWRNPPRESKARQLFVSALQIVCHEFPRRRLLTEFHHPIRGYLDYRVSIYSFLPFLRFFQNVALCVFLDFYLLYVRIYNYIFSSLVDEKSSRGWQISRTKSFKTLIALSSRIVILLLIAYISILSVSLLDVLLEENLRPILQIRSRLTKRVTGNSICRVVEWKERGRRKSM